MAEAFPGAHPDSTEYGTKNCPLRKKLRVSENRQETFKDFPVNESPLPIDLLVSLGFFYSTRNLVFCVWCWQWFPIQSRDPENHPAHCRKSHLADECDTSSISISGDTIPSSLNFTVHGGEDEGSLGEYFPNVVLSSEATTRSYQNTHAHN